MSSGRDLYLFLDEAGNFDFSPTGTRYFVLTSLAKYRPFDAYKALTELKYDLIELGINLEYFHAAEDQQATRHQVFDIIAGRLAEVRLDSWIIEKRRVGPALRAEAHFYPALLGSLLTHVLHTMELRDTREVIIVTDRIPLLRKREAVEKAVKTTLAATLPSQIPYRVLHHESKSNLDLQIVDYCNWAVYRKWDRGDLRSYGRIQAAVHSESEFFGQKHPPYY